MQSSKKLITIFTTIGALIMIIGVIILVVQHWDEIGFIGRAGVTLGFAVAAYVAGILMKTPSQSKMSQIFFTIAAVLAPIGVFVVLREMNVVTDARVLVAKSLILGLIFFIAYIVSRRPILTLITIGYGTLAYYATQEWLLPSYTLYTTDVLKWSTFILGAAYIALGYAHAIRLIHGQVDPHDEGERASITRILYTFGTIALLGAGILIGGYFDIFYTVLLFGMFYLSVFLRSRAILVLSVFFLVIHIFNFTAKHFMGSLGWPISLILIGFAVIGVGYFTMTINRKFAVVR